MHLSADERYFLLCHAVRKIAHFHYLLCRYPFTTVCDATLRQKAGVGSCYEKNRKLVSRVDQVFENPILLSKPISSN